MTDAELVAALRSIVDILDNGGTLTSSEVATIDAAADRIEEETR